MVTWTTRTAQTTGPHAVWRTSSKQRKVACPLVIALAKVLIQIQMTLMTRLQMTTTPALAKMLRTIRSTVTNSSGLVSIPAILGSARSSARKLARLVKVTS